MRAAGGQAVGEAVLKTFHRLLARDLSTQPIQKVHGMLDECVGAVDPGLSLHVFGSATVYGFHNPDNDVDFVVLRPEDRQSTVTVEDTSSGTSASCAGEETASTTASSTHARARLDLSPTGTRSSAPAADATSQLAKSLQLDCLGKLEAELLRRHGATWSVHLVRRARVPVLRAARHLVDNSQEGSTHSDARVDFDVTAHRLNGVRNSCLLHHYYAQAPHARWLGLAVKHWSKQVGLNGLAAATEAAASSKVVSPQGATNTRGGGISAALVSGCLTSYAFNLMVIYYLLQRGIVQFVDPAHFLDISQTPAVPHYVPLQAPLSAAELGDSLVDFAAFYSEEFDPATEVVSLSRSSKTTPQQLGWTRQAEDRGRMQGEKTNYRLCIEDPYEINLNVGRFVTPFKLMLWQKHLQKARQTGLLFVP